MKKLALLIVNSCYRNNTSNVENENFSCAIDRAVKHYK